jgi:hypothetical protein
MASGLLQGLARPCGRSSGYSQGLLVAPEARFQRDAVGPRPLKKPPGQALSPKRHKKAAVSRNP